MKLTKEPKEVDFLIKSEPWSERDLADFRALIKEIKNQNKLQKTKKLQNQLKSQYHLR